MSKKSDSTPKVLTESQEKKLLALLTTGFTVSSAAKSIGFPPTLLQSLILANSELSAKVKKAEEQAELYFVMRVREAAKNPHSWRAAAWWLEHRKPKTYGKPNLKILEAHEVENTLKKLLELAAEFIPENRKKDFSKAADKLFSGIQ